MQAVLACYAAGGWLGLIQAIQLDEGERLTVHGLPSTLVMRWIIMCGADLEEQTG